ncbi:MAG TPA: gluconate 2-dehydrogenase subunit 3 family protein [Gemmatimonadales bacterium]|nr:gluconate 2-dehydrogenase subunit 3 family protein [Gemmatimonadales bacterium]
MTDIARRDVLGLMAAIPLLRAKWEQSLPARPPDRLPAAFFTATEFQTVRILADLIVPRDDHSGSASDAGVPEFLDFVMTEWPDNQTPIRGGLAWLDRESTHRSGKPFREVTAGDQAAILDDIAYPARAKAEMAAGVEFFTRFRDLVLSGFYSSKEGVKDLGYRGNTFVTEWKGCPQ